MIFIKIIFLENGVKVILFVLSLRRLNKQQKVILKMEDEKITLAEPELPQLRQTVLENTRRISRNEQMIDQMRKKEVEEERKRRERDEFWENVRRKHALAQQDGTTAALTVGFQRGDIVDAALQQVAAVARLRLCKEHVRNVGNGFFGGSVAAGAVIHGNIELLLGFRSSLTEHQHEQACREKKVSWIHDFVFSCLT